MLAINRSAGVTPEVNLKKPLHTGKEVPKQGIHPAFETLGRHGQNRKTGALVVQQGLMSSKICLGKKVVGLTVLYFY